MALTFKTREKEPGQISYLFTARLVKERKGARPLVLDMACSTGESTEVLSRELPEAEIYAVDLDPAALAACERKSLPNVRCVRGNALHAPFPDAHFDAIVSGHTIEHMHEPEQKQLLRELMRLLKRDGVLVISTPDVDVLRLQGAAGTQPDHVRELRRAELAALLHEAGFSVDGWWGQGVLEREATHGGRHILRTLLNIVKKIDILKLRRLLPKRTVDRVDVATHPFTPDFTVRPLAPDDRAYNMIAVCGKR